MSKRFLVAAALLVLLAFVIPIEHKYDKLFRFYSLTLIPQGLEVSQSYEKKIYFYVSDLISISLISIGLIWFRIPLRRFFGNPLWIVFFLSLASIVISPFFNYPIPYIRLLQLLTPIALFSFVSTAFSDVERSKITHYILVAIVSAGLFQTAVSITQYFYQAPLGLRLLGETNERTIFSTINGTRWLIDELLHRKAETVVVMRAAGTFPHSNVFGGFMVFSLLATYALLMQTKKRIWLLALPVQFFAMSLSYSRSALFAWAIATVIWFALMFRQYGPKNTNLRHIGAVLTISFALTATLLYTQYLNRGGVINYNALAQDSDNIRKFHQLTAVDIIKNRPFLGLGFTQFSEGAHQFFPEDIRAYVKSTAPHNIFLFLACETGLLSLAAFLIWIATLFRSCLRTQITAETAAFTALLTGFIFIGCCDFYPILFQQGKIMFFLIAALLYTNNLKKRSCVEA